MTNMPRLLKLARPLAANAAADPGDVHDIKTLLADLGHYDVPDWGVSEQPDRALFDAIRAFQRKRGLKVDGVMKPGGETEVSLRTLQTRTLKTLGEELRAKGRNGDTILAHITLAEAQLLDAVTDGGSINPETGLPEFFDLGGLFSGLADGFSKGLNSLGGTFDDQFVNTAASVAGEVVKRKVGDYVGKKIGGPVGRAVGDAIGQTVGGFAGDMLDDALKVQKPKTTLPKKAPLFDVESSLVARDPRWKTPKPPFGSPLPSDDILFDPNPSLDDLLKRLQKTPKPHRPKSTFDILAETSHRTPGIVPEFPRPPVDPRTLDFPQPGQRQSGGLSAEPLPAEIVAANARLADALLKTTDYSAIKPHVQDALAKGEKGRAEVLDLAQQMDQRQPGAGQKFAQDMGLEKTAERTSNNPISDFEGLTKEHYQPPNSAEKRVTGTRKRDEPTSLTDKIEKPTSTVDADIKAAHEKNYERTKKLAANGYYNDGFIGRTHAGDDNGIDWNDKSDVQLELGPETFGTKAILKVDGPIRLEPSSPTAGAETSYIQVSWHPLDENGNYLPEIKKIYTKPSEFRQHSLQAGFNTGAGYLEFAPPFAEPNPYGYHVIITKPAHDLTHGNAFGTSLNVYSQKGGMRVQNGNNNTQSRDGK